MKTSTGTLKTALKNLIVKTIFCSQLIIVSLSLPSLFYVGITYNKESGERKHLIITNKGKKILAQEGKTENNLQLPLLGEL